MFYFIFYCIFLFNIFIQCLLTQNSVWSIHVSALLQRSLLEKDSKRSVERAMQQIEVNIN